MRRLLIASLLALAACSEGVPADTAAARAEVQATITKWHSAYDAGNLEALEALLDPEVSLPSPPSDFLHGKENVFKKIKKDVEEYVLAKDFANKRKTHYGEMQISISGNLAVVRYDATINDPNGVASALFTRILRKSGGAWLILSDHYTFTPLSTKQPPPK